jgi:hypothetical protein
MPDLTPRADFGLLVLIGVAVVLFFWVLLKK